MANQEERRATADGSDEQEMVRKSCPEIQDIGDRPDSECGHRESEDDGPGQGRKHPACASRPFSLCITNDLESSTSEEDSKDGGCTHQQQRSGEQRVLRARDEWAFLAHLMDQHQVGGTQVRKQKTDGGAHGSKS